MSYASDIIDLKRAKALNCCKCTIDVQNLYPFPNVIPLSTVLAAGNNSGPNDVIIDNGQKIKVQTLENVVNIEGSSGAFDTTIYTNPGNDINLQTTNSDGIINSTGQFEVDADIRVELNSGVDTQLLIENATSTIQLKANKTGPTNGIQCLNNLTIRDDNVAKLIIGGINVTLGGAYTIDGITFQPVSGFINLGQIHTLLWSDDRKIWVAGVQPTSENPNNGPALYYSYDGKSFTPSPNVSNFMTRVFDIAYSSQQQRFVAVGGRLSNTATTSVAYSSNGINWTAGSPINTFTVEGRCVCYSPTLNQWVCSGREFTYYSSDGISWTNIVPPLNNTLRGTGVAWFGGTVNKYIMANATVGTIVNSLCISSDGINWTGLGLTVFTTSASRVAVNPENTLCVIVGAASGGNSGLCYSSDLTTFTFVAGIPTLTNITYSPFYKRWYAVGSNAVLYTSPDGINWTLIPAVGTPNSRLCIGSYSSSGLEITAGTNSAVSVGDFRTLNISENGTGLFIEADVQRNTLTGVSTNLNTNIVNVTSLVGNTRLFVEGNSSVTCALSRYGTGAPRFETYRSRGTKLAPTILATNDEIGQIAFLSYNGIGSDLGSVGYVRNALIYPFVRDVSGTIITPALAFGLGTDVSNTSYPMIINSSGEVTIGKALNSPIISSAILELSSVTKGFLPPRMTATQGSAISSPAEGLMIYVTDTNGTFTSKGWWGWDGSAWKQLG